VILCELNAISQAYVFFQARGHVSGDLPHDSSPAQLDHWLLRSGLPPGTFINLPPLPERQLAEVRKKY
jgi:hypothetical protein